MTESISLEQRVKAHNNLSAAVERFFEGLYKLADQRILPAKYRTNYEIRRVLLRYTDLFMLLWRRERRNSLFEEQTKQRIEGFCVSLDRLASEIENGEHRTNDRIYQALRKRLDRFYAEWKQISFAA